MDCHVQIFLDNCWKTAAVFEPDPQTLDKGVAGGGRLQYDIDYAVTYLGNRAAELIPGLSVGFELFRFEQWPPFLVDLLPGGAGRRAWLRRMQAENEGPQMDWHLLTKGAGAPPGNLRIAEAVLTPPPDHFKIGFPRGDILEQRERFLDYAEERGAHVAGASSVQGEAPKYLLAEDHAGMFHAEGALPDEKIKKFWLVKFPRGRRTDERNQQVLRNEAPYLEVARKFGIRTGEPLVYEGDVLFVPRFDRNVAGGRVERVGMHSLYAVANIAEFGAVVRHDIYCRALAKIVVDPVQEMREYIRRDILNLALRNTDNHGRNTAVLRTNGQVRLSPLFDFAPMFLDPEGIGRVSRWEDEQPGNQPEWAVICEKLKNSVNPIETRTWLADLGEDVKRLPETMHDCHVDDVIIQRLTGWIAEVAAGLDETQPKTWT
ncbi:MAG: HipA domain-containing protein [Desulfobacterales bacterium]|uniref:HipA domain-containing protein n=1 Tax=Candidatus Desulfatibia vada TaxID=2841696 RepID=A0A8J6P2Z6_9BACT|nr:HipA domain-containing protein [Candidatus Desulfatibia vada]MBL6972169.1 HipA domain-containing protein [Desulfobacterales bacterium]